MRPSSRVTSPPHTDATHRRSVKRGGLVPPRTLISVTGSTITVPTPGRLTHLQFRRFAGCPVCHMHLRSVVRHHREIEGAGVREVVLFHSPETELRAHVEDLPFAVVADPDKELYGEFGVEATRRSLLNPRAWPAIPRAVASGAWQVLRGRAHLPVSQPHGGRTGLPADFLIDEDGLVLALKYGEHVDDQWSVDELLRVAAEATP